MTHSNNIQRALDILRGGSKDNRALSPGVRRFLGMEPTPMRDFYKEAKSKRFHELSLKAPHGYGPGKTAAQFRKERLKQMRGQ